MIKTIDFIVDAGSFEIDLPMETEESFDTLSADIHDAIRKDEPSLPFLVIRVTFIGAFH